MPAFAFPPQSAGPVTLRAIRVRDARVLEHELLAGRAWLARWETTNPAGPRPFDVRASIRRMLAAARTGWSLPLVMEVDGELVGQLTVAEMSYGALSSATLGYWIAERVAGRGITPTAVALATDYCFRTLRLHRMEICIRPENAASLAVVRKLGFRFEGLRRRYIHIDGDWRDHFCFALVTEDVPDGVLARWQSGLVPIDAGRVPEAAWQAAGLPNPEAQTNFLKLPTDTPHE